MTLVAAPLAYPDNSAPFYNITKTALYVQKSASGAVASGYYPYGISIQSQTDGSLTFPDSSTQTLPFSTYDGDYEINQAFGSKSDLDAAFPDGTYKMTGPNPSPLSITLTPDTYPTAIPAVTSGTNAKWSNGVLVINPASDSTLNFSNFSTYATAGVAGHMQVQLSPQFQNNGNSLKGPNILSVANPFGLPVQATPFTSYSIPSGTLQVGGVYEATLDFDTAVHFDTTSVSGGGVVSLFENELLFYVVAPSGGVATQPPVLAHDIADQTGYIGGSVTFAPVVTVGGSTDFTSTVLWYANGIPFNSDGVKYVLNSNRLTINNLSMADAGQYFAKFINMGGLATTAKVTLTVQAAVAPTISVQPVAETVAVGSGTSFSISATGEPPPSYQWQFSTDGGSTWKNLPMSGPYSGQTTRTLNVIGATTALNGDQYRCVVTNSAHSVASKAAKLTVTKKSQVINFPSPATQPFSSVPYVFLQATATSGLPVSFSVVSGPATFQFNTLTITGVGTVTVAANQAGDAQYSAAPEITHSFMVVKGSQTILFPVSLPKTFGNPPSMVNAIATSGLQVVISVVSGPATLQYNAGGATGGGTVGGDTVHGEVATTGNGQTGTYIMTLVGAGTVKLQATQAGNADYLAATPVTVTILVNKCSQTISFPKIANQKVGAPAFALSARSTSGLPITFTVVSGPATISNGKLTVTGAGTVKVEASQAGNKDCLAATPVDQTFTVAPMAN